MTSLMPENWKVLKIVVLAFAVNGDAVQHTASHINELEAADGLILAIISGKELGKILHLVDGLERFAPRA